MTQTSQIVTARPAPARETTLVSFIEQLRLAMAEGHDKAITALNEAAAEANEHDVSIMRALEQIERDMALRNADIRAALSRLLVKAGGMIP